MIPIHVVAGILQRDDKFLIAERPAGKPYSGYWEFPGGKIELNESAEQALIRELHEELGIEVGVAQFLFHHEYTYPDKIVHLQIWQVVSFIGEPQCKEHQQLSWVNFTEMMNRRLLEGNWPIVDKLKRLKGS